MSRWDVEALIRDHLRHPGFGVDDLAKLLFQGVMGMDHLLADRARFLASLAQEWENLDLEAVPGEPLLEPVSPNGCVARLNLRPAKAAGLILAEVGPLLSDQSLKRGHLGELQHLWEVVVALAGVGRIPFSAEELAAPGRAILAGGHPPGHSLRYRELNRPAYRLIHDVAHPVWQDLLPRVGAAPIYSGGGPAGPRRA